MSNVGLSCKREGRKKREMRASTQNFMNAISDANGSAAPHTNWLRRTKTIVILRERLNRR
jgi:hypothetical protein